MAINLRICDQSRGNSIIFYICKSLKLVGVLELDTFVALDAFKSFAFALINNFVLLVLQFLLTKHSTIFRFKTSFTLNRILWSKNNYFRLSFVTAIFIVTLTELKRCTFFGRRTRHTFTTIILEILCSIYRISENTLNHKYKINLNVVIKKIQNIKKGKKNSKEKSMYRNHFFIN